MEVSNVESKSPLSLSLQHLKNGDITAAYEVLGITAEQAEQNDFVNRMIALDQGTNLLLSGHHTQAVEPLRQALPLIELCNDPDAKFIIPTLANFAEGISCLLNNDAHQAVKLLKISNEAIQRMNFFIPGMEKTMLSFKAAAEVALAKTYLNVGDIDEAEAVFGKINQIHQELLSKLDEHNPNDMAAFNEVYGSKVEFALVFMRMDLEALDFDALDRRIAYVKDNTTKLDGITDRLPDSPIREVTNVMRILFGVFETYSRIGRHIILERQPMSEAALKEMLEVDQKLFTARQKAHNAGDRGKPLLYNIEQLKRMHRSLLDIGKVQKKDIGRISGLIALGALVVLLVIVHLTIRTTGFTAILFFFGELVVALIVGFGYGALKFKPLLNLYAEIVSKSEKNA